ncbi:gp53-like domain-containing protein [Pectobacterium sp. LFLA-215]|uniref:gp53-like domain-containing protein n=1 Tax=Pectobacterium sp. LFLA-215 TaxID=3419008 RepID=UPI003F5C3D5F
MANLPEQKEWIDGIYQLETSDPVIGGPGGISNRQAEQLANRTGYLKEQQEKTGADLLSHVKDSDPHTQYAPKASPALTGMPTAPTAAAGANSAQIATTAYVMAAITALVNGSPGALDTLKELASALGNDPNFSTTILNKLAQKLEKEQNGADIPDKAKFMDNVGLKSAATRAVGSGASDIPDITVGDGRYLGKTATAAAATKLAAARKIAGIAFDGTADIALTPENIGALPAVGGTLTGNLISTVADVLRMVYGGYGAILRQDGGGFYILLTNKDAANGAFNSLRPLRIDLATGNIEFGHTANAAVLQEKGQRVYSPNNKPAAADIGALPADGTAAAATKLSMARKIAGVAFDGTADITLTPANISALPATGTATAATKLAVARTINGVAFDGTANIALTPANIGALPAAGTAAAADKLAVARTINSVAFDGSADITLTPANIGALPAAGTAASATKLATARTINGVAFDGTANIALTPANIGALPAAGTAAAATKLATARTINGVAFDGTANIALTPANIGALPAAGTAAAATKLATARKINGVAFDGSADINLTPQNLGFGETLLAENGYQKLPSGLIIQWGVANENVTNVFPIPFPNKCFVLNTTIRLNGSPWDGSVTAAYIISNSTFFAGCGDKTGDSMYWFAIGY